MYTHCKRCQAKIPAGHIGQAQHVTCPECNAVLPLNSSTEVNSTPSPRWSNIGMLKGMTVEPVGDELQITRRWFTPIHILVGIIALVWNFIALSVVFAMGSWLGLLIPHVWVGFGLAYYSLSMILNSTVISVSPQRLRIKHGPLLTWGNKTFDPIILRQLYCKEHKHRHNDSVTYTYEVHMFTWDGRNQALLKKLDTPQQALFIEQEIERFLHIKDEPMVGELSDPGIDRWVKWEAWQAFAKATNLTFNSGKLLESFGVYGNYQGYNFGLSAFRKHQNGLPYSRFTIARDSTHSQKNEMQPLTLENMVQTLNRKNTKFFLSGQLRATAHGREISYELRNIPTDLEYLQFIIGFLYDLIDNYPRIVAFGGEAVPTWQTVATDKSHPLQSIASQLIQDIAPTTFRLRDQSSHLLCKRCLTHSGAHEAELSWLNSIIYYGCRMCHQSNDFYLAKSVIAVLDSQMAVEPLQENDELRINWLPRRKLFDFNAVEIVQATDEDVERFAVQVGNDTDPTRQPHYKTMKCVVAKKCGLSENTIRILQRTFGLVEVS